MSNSQSGDFVRRMILATTILGGVTIVALIAAVIAMRTSTDRQIAAFAVGPDARVTPSISLDQPYLSEARVVGFADECLRRVFAHDFLHHAQTVPQAQECFTPASGDEFAQMLQPRIKLMEKERMVMGGNVIAVPRVTRVYKKNWGLGDAQHWDMEAIVELYMEGKNARIAPERQLVRMTVTRVPLQQTPRGVQFSSFKVTPA